jgi:uncharacterized protein YciI
MTSTRHFVYRLIPHQREGGDPRADTAIGEHLAYWAALVDAGRVVVAGPVAGALGVWGLAVVAADNVEQVRGLGQADPAVVAGIAEYEVLEMPSSLVRPLPPAQRPTTGRIHPPRRSHGPRRPRRCS